MGPNPGKEPERDHNAFHRSLERLVDLQNRGVRVGTDLSDSEVGVGRTGGAGPSDDLVVRMGGRAVTLPVVNLPAEQSPYSLIGGPGGYVVYDGNEPVVSAEGVRRPKFYELKTKEGIPYSKIALLHGEDCLASTVFQSCIHWERGQRCKFCAIARSLELGNTILKKTPEQLAEVVKAAEVLDGIRHITLTTGTPNDVDRGALYLAECVRGIRRVSRLPIQVQCEPPRDHRLYEVLKEAGADAIGLHVESFDEEVRRRMTPGKARTPLEFYFEAFERAVAEFGRGQVSTYVIVGLGETIDSIVAGCARAARLGVYPFVVPLRPLRGSLLEWATPPSTEVMVEVYRRVARILREEGLLSADSKAGCVRCGACSVLPSFELEADDLRLDLGVVRR